MFGLNICSPLTESISSKAEAYELLTSLPQPFPAVGYEILFMLSAASVRLRAERTSKYFEIVTGTSKGVSEGGKKRYFRQCLPMLPEVETYFTSHMAAWSITRIDISEERSNAIPPSNTLLAGL